MLLKLKASHDNNGGNKGFYIDVVYQYEDKRLFWPLIKPSLSKNNLMESIVLMSLCSLILNFEKTYAILTDVFWW